MSAHPNAHSYLDTALTTLSNDPDWRSSLDANSPGASRGSAKTNGV
jgi:hypothetical protein